MVPDEEDDDEFSYFYKVNVLMDEIILKLTWLDMTLMQNISASLSASMAPTPAEEDTLSQIPEQSQPSLCESDTKPQMKEIETEDP